MPFVWLGLVPVWRLNQILVASAINGQLYGNLCSKTSEAPQGLAFLDLCPVGGRLCPLTRCYASVTVSGLSSYFFAVLFFIQRCSKPFPIGQAGRPCSLHLIYIQRCSQPSALAALLVLQVYFRQVGVVVLRRLRQALLGLQLVECFHCAEILGHGVPRQ